MWASRIYSRGGLDFRRSRFACQLRDVVALLCKRMYEAGGKQSNYERDGIRDSGILACQEFFYEKWNA